MDGFPQLEMFKNVVDTAKITRFHGLNCPCALCKPANREETLKRQKPVHTEVDYAKRRKKIAKPESCQRCGRTTRWLDAHHPDYSRPLVVEWLCRPCHHVEHNPSHKILKPLPRPAEDLPR